MSIEVQGDTQLIAKLNALENKLYRKYVIKRLREAAKRVQSKVKSIMPSDTGFAKKALKVRVMKRKTGRIGISVGFSTVTFKNKHFYGVFMDLGTVLHEGAKSNHEGFKAQAPKEAETIPQELWKDVLGDL